MKTLNKAERLKFKDTTPTQAKRIGRRIELRSDWEDIKIKVMYLVVREKFKQNEELQTLLLDTGDTYLEEGNNWNDRTWGVVNGIGTNYLGKILMKVRYELRLKNQTEVTEQEVAMTNKE